MIISTSLINLFKTLYLARLRLLWRRGIPRDLFLNDQISKVAILSIKLISSTWWTRNQFDLFFFMKRVRKRNHFNIANQSTINLNAVYYHILHDHIRRRRLRHRRGRIPRGLPHSLDHHHQRNPFLAEMCSTFPVGL